MSPRSLKNVSRAAEEGEKMSRNNVRLYRETLMMSKAELARKAGLSTLTIDRVESGRQCRLDTKRRILLAFGMKVTDRGELFRSKVLGHRTPAHADPSRNSF